MFCGYGFALESGLWMQPSLNYNNSSRSEGRTEGYYFVEINSHRVYNVRRSHSEAETRVAVMTFRANRDSVIELFLFRFCLP